ERASTPGWSFTSWRRSGSRSRAAASSARRCAHTWRRLAHVPTGPVVRDVRPSFVSPELTRSHTSVAPKTPPTGSPNGRACRRGRRLATATWSDAVRRSFAARSRARCASAAREADGLGFGLDGLWTRLDLGAALAQSDRPGAKEVLGGVAEVATERGAQPVAELAEKRLRALGVRTWRRGAGGSALTERELTIARPSAGGGGNPQS